MVQKDVLLSDSLEDRLCVRESRVWLWLPFFGLQVGAVEVGEFGKITEVERRG